MGGDPLAWRGCEQLAFSLTSHQAGLLIFIPIRVCSPDLKRNFPPPGVPLPHPIYSSPPSLMGSVSMCV